MTIHHRLAVEHVPGSNSAASSGNLCHVTKVSVENVRYEILFVGDVGVKMAGLFQIAEGRQ